jgi:uncharacterized SAM-binding protein YcdF (DUF218 family)
MSCVGASLLFLNKLLPVFVLPLGLVVLLLAVALWRRTRWPVVAAIVLLYAVSIPFTGDRLIGRLEARYPAVPVAEVPAADAIVALGGIFGPPAAAGTVPNVSETGERLEAAIRLWEAGKGTHVVFTGARIPWSGAERGEGELARDEAVRRGVPPEAIVVTDEVANTADEARAVARLMRDRGWRRVILITTAWHLPRAELQFRQAGVDCTPFPVDFRRDRRAPLAGLDFLPRADALANSETALRELYGYAFYRLFR